MNKKLLNIFTIIFGLVILTYSIVLYFFYHIKWEELFRLITLSYVFFVYGVLSIKNLLSGKIFLDAFKITIFIYAVFYIVVLLKSYEIWENSSNIRFEGVLSKTEYFLMIFISLVAIKTRWTPQK